MLVSAMRLAAGRATRLTNNVEEDVPRGRSDGHGERGCAVVADLLSKMTRSGLKSDSICVKGSTKPERG